MWCAAGDLSGEVSSEAEIVPWVRGGPRTGRTVELGRGPSVYWTSLGPGEDLGAVGELESLHAIREQSNDGVVIIGGFVIYQPVR